MRNINGAMEYVQLFFTSSIQLSPTGVKVNKGMCIEIYKIAADLNFFSL